MESISNVFIYLLTAICMSIFNFFVIRYFSEGEKITKVMTVVITILSFFSVYMAMNFSQRPIAQLIFDCLLIITGAVDYKTKTIVTGIIYIGGLLAAGVSLLYGKVAFDLILGALLGFAVYLAIYWVARIYYKKEAFGFGDVIFMAAIGGYLGLWHGLLASVLTFYVALFFIILFAVIGKLISRKSEIAFAPYMAVSAWIVSIFGEDLITLYSHIFRV